MAWSVSADIEAALHSAASFYLPAAALAGARLTDAIIARSRRYTSERHTLHDPAPPGEPDADLAARALFFTVADAAKVMVPLAELDARGLLPRGALSILDIGAGVGATSLGVLDYLHASGGLDRAGVRIHALDRDARALALMREAVRELGARWNTDLSLTSQCGDALRALPRPPGQGADLVLAGSLLNELDEPGQQALTRAMLAATHARGAVVIIEPALRHTARALHRLRDWVLESGLAHVFAPCVRALAPCPALARESDWCHEDRATTLPPRTARLAAATGLRTHGLKFAYLVLRRSPHDQVADDGSGRAIARVVSQVQRTKGKHECLVCSDAGRVPLRLLRRHRGADSVDLVRARRGDVLRLPARLAGGGDLAAGDAVTAARVSPPDALTGSRDPAPLPD